MIWTVHFAYDNVGWPSFERAAQMINDTGMFSLSEKFKKNVKASWLHGFILLLSHSPY